MTKSDNLCHKSNKLRQKWLGTTTKLVRYNRKTTEVVVLHLRKEDQRLTICLVTCQIGTSSVISNEDLDTI